MGSALRRPRVALAPLVLCVLGRAWETTITELSSDDNACFVRYHSAWLKSEGETKILTLAGGAAEPPWAELYDGWAVCSDSFEWDFVELHIDAARYAGDVQRVFPSLPEAADYPLAGASAEAVMQRLEPDLEGLKWVGACVPKRCRRASGRAWVLIARTLLAWHFFLQSEFAQLPELQSGGHVRCRWPALSLYHRQVTAASVRDPGRAVNVAVCITGEVRSLRDPVVYRSIRRLVDRLRGSETRLFYVLSLFSRNCTACWGGQRPQTVQHSIASLAEPFSQLPPAAFFDHSHMAVDEDLRPCAPGEQWPPSCRPQFEKLAACHRLASEYEVRWGRSFDWFVRLRPQDYLADAFADIRGLREDGVHAPFAAWADVSDAFAMVPRAFAPAYFSANEFNGGRCLSSDDFQTLRCQGGGCRCRLKQHLLNHSVPVYKLPKMEVFDGECDSPSDFTSWGVDLRRHFAHCVQVVFE